MQYSPEYRIQPERSYLDRLIKETGGAVIRSPEDVYKGEIKDIFGTVDLTPTLLILALILYMLDIALRRLNLPLAAVEEKLSAARARLVPQVKKPSKIKRPLNTVGEVPKATRNNVLTQPESEDKPEKKAKESKTEKLKSESLDTSLLLKRKNRE